MRLLVLAGAAAAMLAVTFLLPEPQHWEVRLAGEATLAGEPYAAHEGGRLAVDLEGSGTFESLRHPARFALAGLLELETQPGARLVFPMLPELDGVTPIWLQLEQGEVFVRTGADYPGNPLIVRTGAADVELRGTALGVLVDERGTCVCVAEGHVTVASDRLLAGTQELAEGWTLQAFAERARGAETARFPAEPGSDEYAHVQRLLEFARE